ncbi:hypothetical protein BJY52DRAFT_761668 [Lactarius psammicola]|nr:hypothetical protein BJY52DRAFT_761668 [Lactarius psammicola]
MPSSSSPVCALLSFRCTKAQWLPQSRPLRPRATRVLCFSGWLHTILVGLVVATWAILVQETMPGFSGSRQGAPPGLTIPGIHYPGPHIHLLNTTGCAHRHYILTLLRFHFHSPHSTSPSETDYPHPRYTVPRVYTHEPHHEMTTVTTFCCSLTCI